MLCMLSEDKACYMHCTTYTFRKSKDWRLSRSHDLTAKKRILATVSRKEISYENYVGGNSQSFWEAENHLKQRNTAKPTPACSGGRAAAWCSLGVLLRNCPQVWTLRRSWLPPRGSWRAHNVTLCLLAHREDCSYCETQPTCPVLTSRDENQKLASPTSLPLASANGVPL